MMDSGWAVRPKEFRCVGCNRFAVAPCGTLDSHAAALQRMEFVQIPGTVQRGDVWA